MKSKRRLFILGSQGIPVRYGGLETFAQELARRLVRRGYEVWVSCEKKPGEPDGTAEWEGIKLYYVTAPHGDLRTIPADRAALKRCLAEGRPGDVAYLLGYGVGPFAAPIIRALKKKGIAFWLNPDGLEWMRPKWSKLAAAYARYCEGFLLRRADLVVCDAAAIKDFHHGAYGIPESRMEVIEYGAPLVDRPGDGVLQKRDEFLARHGLELGEYYTYVGRFVPDNNMELMVRGVLASPVDRKILVCASYEEGDPFYQSLRRITEASGAGHRVVFAGGIYDRELLTALRLGQFAYFHGHEVGGTNPALVEAMGLGSVIVALGTVFNREVLQDSAIFFDKSVDSLVEGLEKLEALDASGRHGLSDGVRRRVEDHYNWERITDLYDELLQRLPD